MDGAHVGCRFCCAAHVGLAHDLEQGGARAIEIDARGAWKGVVDGLAGILLEVRAGDVHHLFLPIAERDRHRAAADNRAIELTCLVTLWQIRIEVVLACELGFFRDFGVDRETEAQRHVQGVAVEDREGAGQTQIERAGLRIGRSSECRRAAREDLRCGRELGMNFQADHRFPRHQSVPPGRASWCSVAC